MKKIKNILLLLTAMSLNAFAQTDYHNIEISDASPTISKSKTSNRYAKSTAAKVSIGNYVWFDHNSNGVQELGELGAYGVELKLYDNSDCTGTVIATTQSSDVGYYKFSDITKSTKSYCIGVEYPNHWTHTLSNSGDDALDSDVISMSSGMGKIENILLTKDNMNLDVGLKHKDTSCQVSTLKVGATGTYDNRKT